MLWVSDSMGALTPPSVRGSPCHQSGGSVPAHNQVLTHGQRTWMALEKHAGRSTETIPRAWERNASHLVLELGGLREERGCRLPVEQREHFGQERGEEKEKGKGIKMREPKKEDRPPALCPSLIEERNGRSGNVRRAQGARVHAGRRVALAGHARADGRDRGQLHRQDGPR